MNGLEVLAETMGAASVRASKVEAREIRVSFGDRADRLPVLDGVSVAVGEGEFVSVIGPSGCGKTTLLRVLAGLEKPDEGDVFAGGHRVTGELGVVGYMPQKDLLMPWKTVLDNTIVGLELNGMPRPEARKRSLAHFHTFGLEGFAEKYPAALSGGMKQRAALLRTFLTGRETLLLDEPLGALDALTRMEMQEWLLGVWASLRKSVLLVTHDIDEAIFLSDRIYVMTRRPGRIAAEIGVPFSRTSYSTAVASPPFARLRAELLGRLTSPDG